MEPVDDAHLQLKCTLSIDKSKANQYFPYNVSQTILTAGFKYNKVNLYPQLRATLQVQNHV